MKIVVTGTLKDNISRDEFKGLVVDAGGQVINSVTKTTGLLIVASKPGNDKITKAEELQAEGQDIEIIGEDRERNARNALHPLNSSIPSFHNYPNLNPSDEAEFWRRFS